MSRHQPKPISRPNRGGLRTAMRRQEREATNRMALATESAVNDREGRDAGVVRACFARREALRAVIRAAMKRRKEATTRNARNTIARIQRTRPLYIMADLHKQGEWCAA